MAGRLKDLSEDTQKYIAIRAADYLISPQFIMLPLPYASVRDWQEALLPPREVEAIHVIEQSRLAELRHNVDYVTIAIELPDAMAQRLTAFTWQLALRNKHNPTPLHTQSPLEASLDHKDYDRILDWHNSMVYLVNMYERVQYTVLMLVQISSNLGQVERAVPSLAGVIREAATHLKQVSTSVSRIDPTKNHPELHAQCAWLQERLGFLLTCRKTIDYSVPWVSPIG